MIINAQSMRGKDGRRRGGRWNRGQQGKQKGGGNWGQTRLRCNLNAVRTKVCYEKWQIIKHSPGQNGAYNSLSANQATADSQEKGEKEERQTAIAETGHRRPQLQALLMSGQRG